MSLCTLPAEGQRKSPEATRGPGNLKRKMSREMRCFFAQKAPISISFLSLSRFNIIYIVYIHVPGANKSTWNAPNRIDDELCTTKLPVHPSTQLILILLFCFDCFFALHSEVNNNNEHVQSCGPDWLGIQLEQCRYTRSLYWSTSSIHMYCKISVHRYMYERVWV